MRNIIFNTVESTLKNAELHYQVEDDIMFRFGISGEHANFEVRLICEEKMETLVAIVTCSICIPRNKIDRMCRWVVEKNYSLTLGEFKIDTRDGELSFRMSCPLGGKAINEDIVGVAISHSLNSFDNTYEEIVKVLYMADNELEDLALKIARERAIRVKDAYESETEMNQKINS